MEKRRGVKSVLQGGGIRAFFSTVGTKVARLTERPAREKRLSRTELLELLVQLSEDNDSLRKENESLRLQLNDRLIVLQESGSIAEAALRLSGIFEVAQHAADDYLRSVERLTGAERPIGNGNEAATSRPRGRRFARQQDMDRVRGGEQQ